MAETLKLNTFDRQFAPRPLAFIFGQSSSANCAAIQLDSSTYAINVMSYEHHEIHSGSHFFYSDGVTLANEGTQDYMITTPDSTKETHLVLTMISGLGCVFTFYEDTDKTGTDAAVAYNSNRVAGNAPKTIIHKGTEGGTTDGTLLATLATGSSSVGGKAGGGARGEEEIVLKRNTKYILRATSGANANNISVVLTFYEHTPKE
jgi:hypothetical protein